MTDVPAAADDTRWPLSYTQEFLWFLGRRWPHTDMSRRFTVSFTIELAADVETDLVRLVLQRIADQHEVLRSAVVEDPEGPWIRIMPEVTVGLTEHRLSDPNERDDESDPLDRLLAECSSAPVAATAAPAARFDLIRTPDRSWLNVTAHHLFFDHWSASLFRREFARLLDRLGRRAPGDEPETTESSQLQYVDFTVWERELLATPQAQAGVDYWVRRLADLPRMELPTDRPRPWVRS